MKLKQHQVLVFGRKGTELEELILKIESYNLNVIVTDSLVDFASKITSSNIIMILVEHAHIKNSLVDPIFFYKIIKLSNASIYLVLGQKSQLETIDEIAFHFDQIISTKVSSKIKLEILDTYCKAIQLIVSHQNLYSKEKDAAQTNSSDLKVIEKLQKKDRLISTLYLQIISYKSSLQKNYEDWKALGISLHDTKARKLHNTLKKNALSTQEDWELFYEHFVQVHPFFFDELKKYSNNLSSENLKTCAYIKIGFSNYDIANHLNILKSSVKRAQTRIKNKLGLEPQQTLRKFIQELEIPSS